MISGKDEDPIVVDEIVYAALSIELVDDSVQIA